MRNVWNSAINIGTFTLKNTETNQVLALDSVVLDSGQRVIVAFGNGDIAAKAQFVLANNYPDQNLSEDGLHWQWQTDLILGDDAARLQLFENNIQRDELRYGDDIGKLAENESSQDSVYVLRRQGYEEGQNASDYPEYSRQTQGWQATDGVAIIYGGYVLRPLFHKRYELKDHLGNVRVIVSDVKDATLGTHGEPLSFAALIEHYSHYYPFGMEKPSMAWDKGGYRYGFNDKENDDEVKGVANSVDFGARIYDSRAARFLKIDDFSNKFPAFSPYLFAANMPLSAVDINGDSLYILCYVSGNHHGDDMFKASALTREHDIKNSKHFNPSRDHVVVFDVQDLAEVKTKVEKAVSENKGKYGNTVEFGIWSHAGFDGPVGSKPTSSNPLPGADRQMDIKGWAGIDFNWQSVCRAGFYGCNTGNGGSLSFSSKVSVQLNFFDVTVLGQTTSAYPSKYVDSRDITLSHLNEQYLPVEQSVASRGGCGVMISKTYLVGGNGGESRNAFLFGTTANPMQLSINGKETGEQYQQGDKK